jgi:uncharacterized protein DUF3558
MPLRRPLLVVSLLGLALASACTTTSQGDPQPATTGASSTSTTGNTEEELPFAGAPKVSDPLDTSRYEQDPCQALTADRAQSLNLPPTGETMENVALGNGCEWKNPETRGVVNIVFIVDDPRGLSPEYEAKNQDFKELPEIEGYPAITRDGADEFGGCTIVVGAADDMAFESIVQLSQANIGKKDPCEVAVQVAGLALQTMKQGA